MHVKVFIGDCCSFLKIFFLYNFVLAFVKLQHSNGLENGEKKTQKKIITILSLLD